MFGSQRRPPDQPVTDRQF